MGNHGLCLSGVGNLLTISAALPRGNVLLTRVTLGLQRARGSNRGPQHDSRKHRGPLSSGPTRLPKVSDCLTYYHNASSSARSRRLAGGEQLGRDSREARDHPAPEPGERAVCQRFQMLLGTTKSTLVWIILYLQHLHCNVGVSGPAGAPPEGELPPAAALAQGVFPLAQLLLLGPALYEPGLPWGLPSLGLASPTLCRGVP